MFTQNRAKSTEFPYILSSHMYNLPHYQYSSPKWYICYNQCIYIDKTYYTKSRVYTGVYPWCCPFCMYKDMCRDQGLAAPEMCHCSMKITLNHQDSKDSGRYLDLLHLNCINRISWRNCSRKRAIALDIYTGV